MYYFAYGSNMNPARLTDRGITPLNIQAAVADNVRLLFNKAAWRKPGVGYATIEPAPGETVEGILYDLTAEAIALLDGYEGYPKHYRRETLRVRLADNIPVEAIAYIAQPDKIEAGLKPTADYLSHLLAGEACLSPAYMARLRQTETL